MRLMVLKVDVDTYRGTRDGVPALLETMARRGARASFLFSLGPDHTGRAIRRVFRPGFFSKVSRTSVLEHYGVRTLLYGTLLPGPDIGLRCDSILRETEAAGHETGIHTWDHVAWQDKVRHANRDWTRAQMQRAFDRFVDVFGHAPATHGAAGWQMNEAALALLDEWGMAYASDGRVVGRSDGPYRIRVGGNRRTCVQLPTTLPTFDELIGVDGADAQTCARSILAMTAGGAGHEVFTLHAELEGARLAGAFATLLDGWQDQGFTFTSLGTLYDAIGSKQELPEREFSWGSLPGRSGELMVAGPCF